MSNENGDDTVMDDAQQSQNGEEAADELELEETKLFLVRATALESHVEKAEFLTGICAAPRLHAYSSFI